MERVLIIGAGAAGMAAAVELARRGIPSTVVEKEGSPGGMAGQLACKGSPQCVRCDACYPRDIRTEMERSPLVTVLTGSEVLEVGRRGKGIEATVRSAAGAERQRYGAVLLASGALAYDADRDARLHHRDCPDVLSAIEAERSLNGTGHLLVPSTGRPPKDLAIIQCVGSRDVGRGVPYCSKVCCKYAYRLGRHLRSLYPELRVTFFFMDWRPLEGGKNALEEWAAGDDKVRIVRSRPAEVLPGDRPVVRYSPPGENVVEEGFDLVMLSVGLVPDPGNKDMAKMLGLELDEFGFIHSDDERMIVAGTCSGPKDIRESVEEGIAAAGIAARALEGA